jgi:hypothetical protein
MKYWYIPLLLNALLASAPAKAEHFLMLSNLKAGEGQNAHTYTVGIIGPDMPGEQINPAEQKLANRFVTKTKEWIIAQYIKRYPEVPRSFFENVLANDDLQDGRSELIVIMDGQDLSKIQGTMRVAWPDKNHPNLPSEEIFGFTVDRPQPALEPWTDGWSLWEKKTLPSSTTPRLTGGIREIKNFVVAHDAEEDFVPVLYYLLEKAGLSDMPVTQSFNITSVGNFKISGIQPKMDFFVYPKTYMLTCNEHMVPYYRRLGFKLTQKEPVNGTNYVMTISREDFVTKTAEYFGRRPGVKIIKDAKWDHEVFEHALNSQNYGQLAGRFNAGDGCVSSVYETIANPVPDMIIKRGARRLK